jgi:hypothetical protein
MAIEAMSFGPQSAGQHAKLAIAPAAWYIRYKALLVDKYLKSNYNPARTT